MSLHKNIINNLRGHSRAMYSTWLTYRPSRLLFDSGEGIGLALRNEVFSVENVLLSHGHYDHIGGLGGLLYARASARGDKGKPLTVHYPSGWDTIAAFRDYISKVGGHFKYKLEWNEVHSGDLLTLGGRKKVQVRVFPTIHSKLGESVGYALIENRTRLKREYLNLTQEEIKEKVKTVNLNESYEKKLISYCGDSSPVEVEHIWGSEVLIHEGTFADSRDRRGVGHSSIQEAVALAKEAETLALMVIHISGRYSRATVLQEFSRAVRDVGYKGSARILLGDVLFNVEKNRLDWGKY